MPSGMSSCLKSWNSFDLNCILLGLNLRLLLQAVSCKLRTVTSWLVSPCPLANTSSAIPVTPGTVLMTASSLFWKMSELTDRPKGSCSHLYFPHGVLNVFSSDLSVEPDHLIAWLGIHQCEIPLCWGHLWSWCNTGSSLCSYWGLLDPSWVSGDHLPSWLAPWSWSTLCVHGQVWWFLHHVVPVVLPYWLPWSWLGLILGMLDLYIIVFSVMWYSFLGSFPTLLKTSLYSFTTNSFIKSNLCQFPFMSTTPSNTWALRHLRSWSFSFAASCLDVSLLPVPSPHGLSLASAFFLHLLVCPLPYLFSLTCSYPWHVHYSCICNTQHLWRALLLWVWSCCSTAVAGLAHTLTSVFCRWSLPVVFHLHHV